MASTGKQYRGQTSYQIKTERDVLEERAAQEQYNHPDAVPLDVYFVHKNIANHTMQAAMRAHTKVQRAVFAEWDSIFNGF